MKIKFLAATLAATVMTTPAFAADFTGFRTEARLGWDRVNLEASYDDGVDAFSGSDHEDGIAYGLEFGYDAPVGANFIVGGYAGIDFASTDYCSEVFGVDEGCIKAGRNITIGARAGVPVSAAALIYAKAGYSNGKIKVSYEDFEGILENFEISEERDGFHVGAGAEMAFGPNVYGKVEYTYTNYNGADFADPDFTVGIDGSRHQVLTGIGFRF